MVSMLIAVLCSLVCVGIHFVLAHIGVTKESYEHPIRKLLWHGKLLSLIWLAVFPFFLAACLIYGRRIIVTEKSVFIHFFYGVTFFAMLFFIYLTFYYIVDRSVSSRIMIEIENTPGKKLTFDELRNVYKADIKYENELKGMAEGGFVVKEDGFYRNTFKGALVAKIAGGYKKIFKLGKGG